MIGSDIFTDLIVLARTKTVEWSTVYSGRTREIMLNLLELVDLEETSAAAVNLSERMELKMIFFDTFVNPSQSSKQACKPRSYASSKL